MVNLEDYWYHVGKSNYKKQKMTEKFQLPYFQKSNGILDVFWAPTYLNSSKTANFLRFS